MGTPSNEENSFAVNIERWCLPVSLRALQRTQTKKAETRSEVESLLRTHPMRPRSFYFLQAIHALTSSHIGDNSWKIVRSRAIQQNIIRLSTVLTPQFLLSVSLRAVLLQRSSVIRSFLLDVTFSHVSFVQHCSDVMSLADVKRHWYFYNPLAVARHHADFSVVVTADVGNFEMVDTVVPDAESKNVRMKSFRNRISMRKTKSAEKAVIGELHYLS